MGVLVFAWKVLVVGLVLVFAFLTVAGRSLGSALTLLDVVPS